MAYLNEEEVYESYQESTKEAELWRKDYPEYERLMDNGLLDALDDNLPDVNDGSLAASLFKFAKRVIKKNLGGRAVSLDRDDKWLTELANLEWTKRILKNAKSKASPRRKLKDAARKAAGLGGQPIVTLMVNRGNYNGVDFIVPYAQDVKLEAGKDSDEDSDIIFWDVYYSKLQVRNMFEDALEETGMMIATVNGKEVLIRDPEVPDEDIDPYNQWNVEGLWDIVKELNNAGIEDKRPQNEASRQEAEGDVKKTGVHFFIAFQRGVDAPFYMCRPDTGQGGSPKASGTWIRLWPNPDPTGDVPVHYLYMYQDFINPYGVGIVKLAGGTQNVLDYLSKADVLATQIGLRPPRLIQGDEDEVDEESMVTAQDANWYIGNAQVTPWNMANGIYQNLPGRMSMYQTRLQKVIPLGDQTVGGADSGDPAVSKVPASIKARQTELSIDDDDFAENIDECWAAVSKNMINTHFANMQGSDILKLNAEEREILVKAGFPFDNDDQLEIEILWDNVRNTFDYEIDPDADKDIDDEAALEGKLKAYEMIKGDPQIDADLAAVNKKVDRGELLADIFAQLTDNDKIIVDIAPEDQADAEIDPETGEPIPQTGAGATAPAVDPATGQPVDPNAPDPNQPTPADTIKADELDHRKDMDLAKMELEHRKLDIAEKNSERQAEVKKAQTPAATDKKDDSKPAPAQTPELTPEDEERYATEIQETMEAYNVSADVAAAMLEADRQGFEPDEILTQMEANGLLPEGTAERLRRQNNAQEAEVVDA